MGNLFENLPDDFSEEHFLDLFKSTALRIERIVSKGHSSPTIGWYDQIEDEWVLVLQGEACLVFADGRQLTLSAGDFMHIPAHTLHQVRHPQADKITVWLAIFFNTA